MREFERIARLLEQTFEGRAYYGPSVLDALKDVSVVIAGPQPDGGTHNIWDLVAHLAGELRCARTLLEGSAEPWIEGLTSWPRSAGISAIEWEQAVSALTEANRPMVQSVEKLDESLLDKHLTQVGRTHYTMLHGAIQHNVYHAGPISLLKRQLKSRNPD